DRIDCISDGESVRLVVIDYKRSGSVDNGDVEHGRATQTVLYTAAVRQLLADPAAPERERWFWWKPGITPEVAGGLYWSVRSGRALHVLAPDKTYLVRGARLSAGEFAQVSLEAIAARIARVRAGDFRPLPAETSGGSCGSF